MGLEKGLVGQVVFYCLLFGRWVGRKVWERWCGFGCSLWLGFWFLKKMVGEVVWFWLLFGVGVWVFIKIGGGGGVVLVALWGWGLGF